MTGKYYIISATVDWADEMDIHFFEILDEEQGRKYKIAQDIFGSLYANYFFGTNEGWEDCDFDLLDFQLLTATEEEVKTLRKFNVSGYRVFLSTMYCIEGERDYYNLDNISMETASVEEFKAACWELKAKYDEEYEEDEEMDSDSDM